MTSQKKNLSDAELKKKFQKDIHRCAARAIRLAYDNTVQMANLGRPSELAPLTWEDTADELRATLGIGIESAFKNLTGAVKLPKNAHIDLLWKDEMLDVKARTSVKSKDISLSEEQVNHLVLAFLYNTNTLMYEVYMGYPGEQYLPYCPSKGKYSMSRGAIRSMSLMSAGVF